MPEVCTALLFLLALKLKGRGGGQKGKPRPKPKRPQDLIGEFSFRGLASNWSEGGLPWAPGPAPRTVAVRDPEVRKESKGIRFLAKGQAGPCYSASALGTKGPEDVSRW